MDDDRKTLRSRFAEALLIVVIVPLVGVLMGGIYSLPAMKLTDERDPGLTVLLGMGLAVTVFGLGLVLHAPLHHLAAAWAVAVLLLLAARRAYGGLGHNLERFGMVHLAAVALTVLVSMFARAARSRLGHP